jgi:hypothetical protein
MYKALFEISLDRADFLSRLFSRPRPAGLAKDAKVDALIEAYQQQSEIPELYDDTLRAVKEKLIGSHGFALTPEDISNLEKVLRAFYVGGPNLTYNGPRNPAQVFPPGMFIMPTLGEIMVLTTSKGEQRSFLASEEHFRTIQQMQQKNLIVPLVGDFGGPKAIRSVGEYLRQRNATVSAFYTSNVEQYLFMTDAWERFYENAATLPVNSQSVFIRGLIRTIADVYSPSPAMTTTSTYETRLFSMADLIDKMKSSGIRAYGDVVGPVPAPLPVLAPAR